MAKKQGIKKFSLPPAKILRFNLKGKSVLDTSIADRLYLAERDEGWFAGGSDDKVAEMAWTFKFTDWITSTGRKDMMVAKGYSRDEALKAAIADGTLPPMPPTYLRSSTETGRTDPPAA
jgi:hypothetical protein